MQFPKKEISMNETGCCETIRQKEMGVASGSWYDDRPTRHSHFPKRNVLSSFAAEKYHLQNRKTQVQVF